VAAACITALAYSFREYESCRNVYSPQRSIRFIEFMHIYCINTVEMRLSGKKYSVSGLCISLASLPRVVRLIRRLRVSLKVRCPSRLCVQNLRGRNKPTSAYHTESRLSLSLSLSLPPSLSSSFHISFFAGCVRFAF
jgi:hypothetical protein